MIIDKLFMTSKHKKKRLLKGVALNIAIKKVLFFYDSFGYCALVRLHFKHVYTAV